ncbi:protein WVD2-like 7 [Oryza brachyantha]|uniref:TPX2 C-terminal domain-containing protein n=1 Tax=Oryza brachyantha TaxID=4533 RepID=J3L6I8_ORYBR|nr:protein WVD2-like 7 [Oryza brachyantha]XP_006645139.1 protein WVD2-like 7 [Oryza brachyantha]
MAAEVNQTFFAWSQGEPNERDGSQGVSVSQKIDHGSISFGRFELESLSWEKWSVFTDDKRHEEFGKFNGLVAQKKAYFEEYYRKIRELKAAQQQNQQTELILEYSGDGSDSSQTGEDMQAAELETPTGSGTIVDDYVEQAEHETTSDQGLTCYDDHEEENFNAESSSSNVSSSAVGLQQSNQDAREDVHTDDSTDKINSAKQNAISGHDLGTTFEDVRVPKRIIEKDSRLRYAPKIIPKSVKTSADGPLNRKSVSKRPDSLKPGMSMNQKAKPDNDRLLRRPNVAPQKMSDSAERNRITAKRTLGVTGVRRPSSASSQRTSARERHHIAGESVKKPADVSTPRRPSTAERHPATTERGRKQADVATPRRPSTSERRAVNRESAEKHAATRASVLKMDVRTPSKTRPTAAQPKGATTTVGIVKKAGTPNASKRINMGTKSDIREPEGPPKVGRHSVRSKSTDLQVASKQKSSSVNLPPRKLLNSSIGEPALETFTRPKKKDVALQSRASTSKRALPLHTGNVKARSSNPPPPPPPPRRPSRMTMNRPNGNGSNSSIVGQKPKYDTYSS